MRSPLHSLSVFWSFPAGILALTVLASVSYGQTLPTWKKVALTGDKVTQKGKKLLLGSFGTPAISSKSSAVAVNAIVYGKGVNTSSNGIIYLRSGGKGSVIARTGLVNLPNETSYVIENRYLNFSPQVGISGKKRVLYSGDLESEIFDPNDTSSGISVLVDGTFLTTSTQNAKQILAAYASTDQWVNFIFTDPYRFNTFETNYAINNAGKVSLSADSTNDNRYGEYDGVWLGKPGTISPVAAVGDTVIGLPIGATYQTFGSVTVDNKGRIYTVVDVSDAGSSFDGIWYGSQSRLDPFVIVGDSTGGNGTFATFSGTLGLSSDSKRATFVATTSTSVQGIFTMLSGASPTLIVKVGATAPGADETFQTISSPGINTAGQVAFVGTVTQDSSTVTGIWATNKAGELQLIALEGASVTVDGVSKKIIDVRFSGPNGLNNKNQVVFTASFSDRTSGVFTAEVP